MFAVCNIWRRALVPVLAALAVAATAPLATAENRLALVIGNDAYSEVAALERAVSDARAYRKLLEEERGFRVFYAENAGRREMNARVAEFLSAITPGDTAMVVYSGHGVQLNDDNRDSLYLLPVDFPNEAPGQGAERHFFDTESLNFARLARDVQARGAKLRLFVLDACRNNPFKGAGPGTRSIGMTRGIGRINSTSGEFVIYAAAPGEVAFDTLPGDESGTANSVFTRAFIKHFREGVYLEDVANDVQAEVVRMTRAANVNQEPYYSDGVAGRTCLEEACGQALAAEEMALDDDAKEKLFWEFCEKKDEPAYCKAYLEAFPDGWRALLARARLAEIEDRERRAVLAVRKPDSATDGGTGRVKGGDKPPVEDRVDTSPRLPDPPKPDLPATGTANGLKKPEPADDEVKVSTIDPKTETTMVKAEPEPFDETRDAIRDVQARLTILGLDPGPIDGLRGSRTTRALERFQTRAGLSATGEIDAEVVARLSSEVPAERLQRFYAEREAAARAAAERAARERAARREAERKRAVKPRRETATAIKTPDSKTGTTALPQPAPSGSLPMSTSGTVSGTGSGTVSGTGSGTPLRTRDGSPVTTRSGRYIRTENTK